MNHNRFYSDKPQIRHVLRKCGLQCFVNHGIATEFNHHDSTVKFPQPIQRLNQSLRLDASERLVWVGRNH